MAQRLHQRRWRADCRPRTRNRHRRDSRDVGQLAKARLPRARHDGKGAARNVRRWNAQLPVHPRLSRRPRTLLHLRGRIQERRLHRSAGSDQKGRLRCNHRSWRHHHSPPRRRQVPPPLVRSGAPRPIRHCTQSSKEVPGPERNPKPRRPRRRVKCNINYVSDHAAIHSSSSGSLFNCDHASVASSSLSLSPNTTSLSPSQ